MKKFIGNKAFYKKIILISVPIILYQALTNFLGLVDNLMVGSLGKEAISGVAIISQILFVFNMSTFGLLAGPGVFIAQFTGAKNEEGIRNCFRYKLIASLIVTIIAISFLILGKDFLINSFLHENTESAQLVFNNAKDYLAIMLWGLPFFIISTVYGTSIRETGHTIIPLIATFISILCNLCLNYILIFGISALNFQGMGIEGAALATVISRIIEASVLIITSSIIKKELPFLKGIYKLKLDLKLSKEIFITGLPLFVNEILWSFGMTFLVNIYSFRGLDTFASFNISSAVSNLFFIFSSASGQGLAIYIGSLLGAKKIEQAKEDLRKYMFFNIMCCFVVSTIFIIAAQFIPNLYDVTPEIKILATRLMMVGAIMLPIIAFNTSCYFTLRAGGVTKITFLFDSAFTWTFFIPTAFLLVHFTGLYIVIIYAIVQSLELIKSFIGYTLIKKNVWVKNLSCPVLE